MHTLVVSLMGALVAGFIYAYSTYANALQAQFDLSESAKENIGLAPSLCNLLTVTNGLIIDYTSVSTGCVIGGLLMMSSYGLFGAIALKYITVSNPAVAFFLLFAIGSYGASFIICATYTVLAKNFTKQRSEVVSIAKSWQGVATGVGTAIFVGLFPSDDKAPERLNFLFFLAIVTGCVPILIAPFLRPLGTESSPQQQQQQGFLMPTEQRLPYLFSFSLVLIVVTLASAFHRTEIFSVVLLLILLSPLVLIFPEKCASHDRAMINPSGSSSSSSPADDDVLLDPDDRKADDEGEDENEGISPWEGGPLDLIRRPEFYLLWICSFALQSGGLFLTTNLGSMTESRSGAAVASASAVTVFSCAQGLARLVTGSVSNKLVERGWPRTWYLPAMMVVMALGHGVLCIPGPEALLGGTALCGWAFGSCFPLLVLAVAEIFGKKRLASNYMIFDGSPGAIGALLFAKFLAQAVYKAHEDSADEKCHGDICFRLSHVVIVVAQLIMAILGCILSVRVRVVYEALAGGKVS